MVGKSTKKQLFIREIPEEEHPLITCHTIDISAQWGDERFSNEGYYKRNLSTN